MLNDLKIREKREKYLKVVPVLSIIARDIIITLDPIKVNEQISKVLHTIPSILEGRWQWVEIFRWFPVKRTVISPRIPVTTQFNLFY